MLAPQGVSMVVFHPLDAKGLNFSEQEVIDALREVQGHDDIHIYHSLNIAVSDERLSGEADLVVVVPNQGVVIVEIKGGKSADLTKGNVHIKGAAKEDKDPFLQVEEVKKEIQGYLDKKGLQPPIARAVWLPLAMPEQIKFKGDIDRQLYELLTRNDLDSPVDALLEVLHAYNTTQSGKKYFKNPDHFNGATLNAVRQALHADLTIEPNKELARQLHDLESSSLEISEMKYLTGIEGNQHIYFYGAAGTGKSLMIAELARRAEENGGHVLFTAWNRSIAKDQKKRWGGAYSNMDFEDLGALMLRHAGIDERPSGGDQFYFDELPRKAIEATKNNKEIKKYDLIAVDEYQDVANHPIILEFLRLIGRDQSWDSTRLYLAGDKYQQIMRGKDFSEDPHAIAAEYVPNLFKFKLVENYRNSFAIADALTKLCSAEYESVARTVSPGQIEIVEVSNETLPRETVSQITNLRKLFDDQEIRVLSAASFERSTQRTLISGGQDTREQAGTLKDLLKDRDTGLGVIPWDSIARYKGLESDAVIIMDVTKEVWDYWESKGTSLLTVLYVGFSRAHHHVSVLCDHFVAEKLRALGL
jgi:hypothetical protein